jgi:hypothetical protein
MTTQNDQKDTKSSTEANASDQSTKPSGDAAQELIDEFTNLGQKVVEVIEVAWKSDQRKKIEVEVRSGIVTLANALEDGFKRVSNTKEAKDAVNAAEDVAEKVRTSKMASDLSSVLAQGLHALSDQVEKLSNEIRQKGSSSSTGEGMDKPRDEAQDIPINRDNAE